MPKHSVWRKRMQGGEPIPSSGLTGVGFARNGLAGTEIPQRKRTAGSPVIIGQTVVMSLQRAMQSLWRGGSELQNIGLTSAVITMNMDSSTVYTTGVTDAAGVETGSPVFKDGDTV